jgi:hypothetical protein
MIYFKAGKPAPLVKELSFDGKLVAISLPDAFFANFEMVGTLGEHDFAFDYERGENRVVKVESSRRRIWGVNGDRETTIVVSASGAVTPVPQTLRVKVEARRSYGKTIIHLDNAFAVRQFGPPEEVLSFSKTPLPANVGETGEELMRRVAATGSYEHIYLSCHQAFHYLKLGAYISFDQAGAFAPLRGKVKTLTS